MMYVSGKEPVAPEVSALLTKALPASAVWEDFSDSSQLPLLSSAHCVQVSLQRDHDHVVVSFLKEMQNLKED